MWTRPNYTALGVVDDACVVGASDVADDGRLDDERLDVGERRRGCGVCLLEQSAALAAMAGVKAVAKPAIFRVGANLGRRRSLKQLMRLATTALESRLFCGKAIIKRV